MKKPQFPWLIRKQVKRWDRKSAFTKRQVFVIITLILTAGLLTTQLVSLDLRYPMVAVLSVSSYIACAFALRHDLKGLKWITLLLLPMAFTAAISLFYFLLPVRWLTRIPVVVFYAVGMYALLLTENIYNVAAERSIQLLRAAHTIGFLLTLITFFLLIQTILALKLDPVFNSIVIAVLGYFLVFQSLWAIELSDQISRQLWDITITLTFIFAQLAWVLSFVPVRPFLEAVFLTTVFYSLVGMAQQYLVERLYKRTVTEFFIVLFFVFLLLFVTLNWRTAT